MSGKPTQSLIDMEKVLVFDVWSEYAHFRKFFTTTSPLTFSLPPRTALCGLMGAILGFPKDTYLSKFLRKDANFAVRLMNPVKKVRFSENLIDTDSVKTMNIIKQHTRIKFEFLKDAKFRIYFSHSDPDLYSNAREMISAHKCVYTPFLGISEHIANFSYIGEYPLKKIEKPTEVAIDSIIPKDQILQIQFESGKEYMTETLPNEMAEDRTVNDYKEFTFERNCKPISAGVNYFYELGNNDRILFM
jgi:CRISPR-associated protein Cas5h